MKSIKTRSSEKFDLIAKHCPVCNSLIKAKRLYDSNNNFAYSTYHCSVCSWKCPHSR